MSEAELLPSGGPVALPEGASDTLPSRLTAKIVISDDGCWLWIGAVGSDGYGVLGRGPRGTGNIAAHRAMWTMWFGSPPDGLQFDHLCRNRRCCNPSHGEYVTQQVNVLRGSSPAAMHAKNPKCPRGHPKDGLYPGSGWRYCKTCARARSKARSTGRE